jgi:hypothetical protein
MRTFLIIIISLLFADICLSQAIPADSMYLAQVPPTGITPKRFFLPVSPQSFTAERIAISNDGKEIFYSVIRNYYPSAGDTIKCFKYTDDKWTGPFNLFNGYLAPALSLSGDTIYFMNNSVVAQTVFSVRNGSGWSNPQRILYNLNWAHYFQVTNSGDYYVSSVSNPTLGLTDWCKLQMTGSDSTAVSLGLPLNNTADNLDFFVARDESFMIIAKNGLQISYHKNNGGWTNPKSLGSAINFGLAMWGPVVSSDNKYLFYTTGTNPNYSDTYIYWSRIDGLIDSLKHTNFIPYLKNQIQNQTDTVGNLFNFAIPDSTFIDDDGNNTLTYTATLSNGNPLPSWLSFNPATRTFTGTPTAIGLITLKVVAKDAANSIAYSSFNLNVVNHVSIRKLENKIINECKLFQNFPNPFNPSTVISYSLLKDSNVKLKLYDVLGKEIASLVNSYQKCGMYEVTVDMNNLNLTSGIYFYTLSVGESNLNSVFKETKVMNYVK